MMYRRLLTSALLLTLLSIWSCNNNSTPEEYNRKALDPALLHQATEQLTDVIVYDIFKPPVASRVYAYTYLAAYEVLRNHFPEYPTLAGKLNDFQQVPKPKEGETYCFPLASMKAFTTLGKTLTFSTPMWDEFEKEFYQKYETMGIPKDVYQRSIAYGEKVAEHVLFYAESDHYKQTRGLRYTITDEPGSWQPTPPTYAEACEPQWNTIRSFTLDTCSQFTPPLPVAYDMSENSKFHELLMEVYNISKNMTEEQKEIAYFWDDNATVTNIRGHASFLEKKMTPPGHWIAITSTVARDKEADMMQSLEAYTLSSIALFDGFIASWDEKYRSARIRPVTVINEFLDADWTPFLETPPFPEYVSGHSAISAAAGRILTNLFGDKVAFTDSTEHKYGHGVRSFESFEQAYWETSWSRVYGGIHFRDAVEEGTRQGEKVGDWVWETIKDEQAEDKHNTLANEGVGYVK